MVNTYAVVNSILKEVDKYNVLISPIKLHSLIYLVYANYLYLTGEKLFNELFTVKDGVPILPSIFNKFYSCDKYIKGYAIDALDKIYIIKGESFNYIVRNICRKYILFTDNELIDLINLNDRYSLTDDEILLYEGIRNGKVLKKTRE